ncbi:MAG: HD domain-containing protein [Spirochaetes bacterium]|nr:HD domain-containing protein [Spirochaetota bacterium]
MECDEKKRKLSIEEIIKLSNELNTIQDLDILLEKLLYEARKSVNADAGSIYIKDKDELVFSHVQNDTLIQRLPPGQKLIYSTFRVKINTRSISGFVASTGTIVNIPDVYNISPHVPYKFNSTYDEISKYKTTSMLTVPLQTVNGTIIGVLQLINAKDDKGNVISFTKDDEPIVMLFANNASLVLQRAQMTRALLLRMISMAELRDPKETGAHVNRVATYAIELYERWAKNHSIDQKEIETNRDILRMAAMLHDVGKVAISDLILKKPGRFTKEEYDIIKGHTFLGARLFKDTQSQFDEIASIVALTHHENWDGTGYPGYVDVDTGKPLEKGIDGKPLPRKGEEIPIFGRIVSLADVYDALSSRRVYKDAWDENDVLNEIKNASGKKFDPELVDIFFECHDFLKSIRLRYPDSE